MDDKAKRTFYDALLKTKYGKVVKKKVKKKLSKVPLSLKMLGEAALVGSGEIPIELKKKLGKDSSIILKGNPRKKSIGLWYTKSF
jgi:hypothetical protein